MQAFLLLTQKKYYCMYVRFPELTGWLLIEIAVYFCSHPDTLWLSVCFCFCSFGWPQQRLAPPQCVLPISCKLAVMCDQSHRFVHALIPPPTTPQPRHSRSD